MAGHPDEHHPRAVSCARRPPKISARWFRMRARHTLPLFRGNLYRRNDHWYMVHASGSEGTKIGVSKNSSDPRHESRNHCAPRYSNMPPDPFAAKLANACHSIASCSLPARFRGAGCRRIRAVVLSCKLVSPSETEHGQCAAQTSCAPSVFQNNTPGPSRNPIP